MSSKQATDTERASARSDLSLDATRVGPQEHIGDSHVVGCDNMFPVIAELLRTIPATSSEETRPIWEDENHVMRLDVDGAFLGRILPLVFDAVLRFFGVYLRSGWSWENVIPNCSKKSSLISLGYGWHGKMLCSIFMVGEEL